MDKKTQKILMIAGVGVAAYLVYTMMKKDTSTEGGTSRIGNGDIPDLPEEEVFDPIDYAMNTWGVGADVASQIKEKADYILNHPESDWYRHTVKRAQEEDRELAVHALHEGWWNINTPNRMLEYVENTWDKDSSQAREILEYVDNKIKPNSSWVDQIKQKARDNDRSEENQYLHDAHWMLYIREGAKYGFSG